MNCLKNYIGAKGCSDSEPDSGLYINSLPGISQYMMDLISNREQLGVEGLWEEVENRTLEIFSSFVVNKFKARYKIRSLTQSVNLGKIIDKETSSLQSVADDIYRGLIVDINSGSTSTKKAILSSQLQVITVQSLSIYLPTNPSDDIDVVIIDGETGDALDSFIIKEYDSNDATTGKLGWNLIKVNKVYFTSKLLMYYDATIVNSVYQSIPEEAINSWKTCCNSMYKTNDCDAYIRGIHTDNFADTLVYETGNNTFGLSAIFSIGCKYDALICDNKEAFKIPLWYLLGAELINERLYSERLNEFTVLGKDEAKELFDTFKYEFEKTLADAINGIDLSKRDCCIECNAPVQLRESYF